MTNKVITKWTEGMSFETISPNGISLRLGSSLEGDSEKIASPKALMLSSFGCMFRNRRSFNIRKNENRAKRV